MHDDALVWTEKTIADSTLYVMTLVEHLTFSITSDVGDYIGTQDPIALKVNIQHRFAGLQVAEQASGSA